MFEGLLSRTEVSKRLGICTDTVTRWVKEGYIPEPVRIGGRRLFWKESEIDEAKHKILNVNSP